MSKRYFHGGGMVEKTLRFFNLLEPKHMVLSLSKLMVYATAGLLAYVLTHYPDQLAPILGALSGFGSACGNYGYRRYMQYGSGEGPYSDWGDNPSPVDTTSPGALDKALDKVGDGK